MKWWKYDQDLGGMISRLIQKILKCLNSIWKNLTNQEILNFMQENGAVNPLMIDNYAAHGGRMGYAMGAEVPARQNEGGVN